MKWPVILLNESGSYPSSSLTDSISRSQVPDPRADNTLSFLVELLHWIFFFLSVSPSVMSGSVWSRGLWPARVLCPWDSPGKDTGVGCHFPLPGNLPTPQGIEPASLASPVLVDSLPLSHLGSPISAWPNHNPLGLTLLPRIFSHPIWFPLLVWD